MSPATGGIARCNYLGTDRPDGFFFDQGRVQGDELPDHWFIEEANEDRKILQESSPTDLEVPDAESPARSYK